MTSTSQNLQSVQSSSATSTAIDSHEAQPNLSPIHHQIVIVGGGAAGITVAAQLLKHDRSLDVAIIEPSDKHYYQPGWTLVGGGVFPISKFVRDERDVIPDGATWIQARVAQLDPDHNTVVTQAGQAIAYEYLVLCPGIQLDWHLIQGLPEALGKAGVTSNYSKDYAPYTWETIQTFRGGNALFTQPATPIKCGGAPQKVMYMADDTFKSKSGVGVNTTVMFCTATASMFSVPEYSAALDTVVARRGITTKFKHNLKAIKADTQEAIFDVTTDSGVHEVSIHYDMIHVTPPMSPPDFVKHSPLAGAGGWIDVHPETLQHTRYPNVFALGDASSLPTSKTAAAVRKEAPIAVQNLLSRMRSQPFHAQYDGYTCCPLITGYHSTIMAEFAYGGKLAPSFPLDPTKERYSMYLAKAHVLPWLYWNRMLKGEGFEADVLKPLQKLVRH
ncbi:FAD-dependent oxidoreductase [Leptolyngbya sp. AN02str]|uniref:NAD(P)/FAD-dependent oxidoreductase n=1 Tax=Leptolyngbya sp. AN02str TaxID=3423363 RepID=UPI003D32351D